ncbi:MAG TPA: tRNA (adenosine(37)-N6)-threonylcarbamoyltransferase complex dimerization subunit type 1 TsaB [Terriglobales bacterium]|nr:tRNA (adenosine(37)-N6)-threonylcarbamoyltransferase complex dimerization subunit type 1 TsaB [Terriglobales bacterium]
MLVLAIDTSGREGSLALAHAELAPSPEPGGLAILQKSDLLELVALTGRMYSAELIPQLTAALGRRQLEKHALDALVAASGPGSFTGLRVGLSTVKGLAEILHKPIAAVSVLEAIARMAGRVGRVVSVLDAGRSQVFVGEYEFGDDYSPLEKRESLVPLEQWIGNVSDSGAEVRRHGSLFVTPDENVVAVAAARGCALQLVCAPKADLYARIGLEKILRGETVSPERLEANYIRASDAEIFSLPKLSR